ncbi:MAG: hypothetical protein NC177_14250 [Ruminococcus flavefaciens]|nr:hypothetical protein [Ruminococcus flavefaciens]
MIYLFMLTAEITVVYVFTVCLIIGILSAWEWVISDLKEEARLIEEAEKKEEECL